MSILNSLGLFSSLNLGQRAVTSQTAGLQITGRNIANVNTPGYTRQRAVTGVTDTRADAVSGESFPSVQLIRDEVTERLLLQERGRHGSLERHAGLLSQVETAFNEPSDSGLNASMAAFFNSAEDLANTPESAGARRLFIERGGALAIAFQSLTGTIETIRNENVEEARILIDDANVKLEQVARLNAEISRTPDPGNKGELQTRQNQLLNDLAKVLSIRVAQEDSGVRTVTVNGLGVVNGSSSAVVSMALDADQMMSMRITLDGDTIALNPTGGSLDGLMEAQNDAIPSIANDVHSVARAIVDGVNELHPGFFAALTDPGQRTRAGAFIDVQIVDADAIQPSSTGQSGGNDVALAISALRDLAQTDLGGTSVLGYYRELVSAVGARVSEMDQRRDTSELVAQQLQMRREAISGVSLDEEAANMIMFQRSFQAAASYISVVDNLLETIISRF